MARIPSDLQRIAAAGGTIEVSAKDYIPSDLERVAAACRQGGGSLFINDSGKMITSDIERVAKAAPGRVIIR